MEQITAIKNFCRNSKFFMMKFEEKNNLEFGKIIQNDEILAFDLSQHEIHRSIEFDNGDYLFSFSLKDNTKCHNTSSPIQLLIQNLKDAQLLEVIYPNVFTWIYDGVSIKALARIPSSDKFTQGTISRYGGTEMFVKILRQHLENISKMHKGLTPDYSFLNNEIDSIEETEICIGSINKFNDMHVVPIDLTMSYKDILINSRDNIQFDINLNILDVKFWTKQINPDFVVEAKHIKLENRIDTESCYNFFPSAIKNLMMIKTKGNYNRFLLAKFLLSCLSIQDAKYVFETCLSDDERQKVKDENQWNYVVNNMKRYQCPTFAHLKEFVTEEDKKLSHPLELIQEELERRKNEQRSTNE